MNTLVAIAFTLITVQDVREHCPVGYACTQGQTIYMRARGELTGTYTVSIDLNGIHIPHFQSTDHYTWRVCGEAIAKRAGIPATWNDAAILCHEVAHVAGYTH